MATPTVQRDLVLRWIEQLARLIARLLRGGAQADLAAAQDQVREAISALLGPLEPLVPRLEVSSAAELLADPDRIFGYAQLLELEGVIAGASGDPARAADARERAVALAREALARTPEPRPDWQGWVGERRGGPASDSG